MKIPRKPKESSFLFDLFGFPVLPIQGALRVKKRDGHIEPFCLQKLSESIKKALQSAGIEDNGMEYSLATAIKNYLRECYGLEAIVTSEQIETVAIQAMEEMGLVKAVRKYEEFSRQKNLQRNLIKRDKTTLKKQQPNNSISQEIFTFEQDSREKTKQKIIEFLAPMKLNERVEEKIINQVFEILEKISYTSPSNLFIRELCLLVMKKEGIVNPVKSLAIHMLASDCIEVMESIYSKESTPSETDKILGRRVKEELSRAIIFSPEIIKAHDEGFIYIHTLDKPDRLCTLHLPANFIWPSEREKVQWINTPYEFLTGMILKYSEITEYFLGPVNFWGFNWAVAPLLKALEGNEYEYWYYYWIAHFIEFAEVFPGLHLILDESVPEKWEYADAVGTQGKKLGAPYYAYKQTAIEMMTDTLEHLSRMEMDDTSFIDSFLWRFNLPIELPPSHSIWSKLVTCVEDENIPMKVCFTPTNEIEWGPQITLGKITVNLARIACIQPREELFYPIAYQILSLVIRACEEMLTFYTTYLNKGKRNLWRVPLEKFYRTPANIPTIISFPINIHLVGVNESVKILNMEKQLDNMEILQKAEELMKRIRGMLNGCIKNKKLKIHLSLETEKDVLENLLQKDIEDLPDLLPVLYRDDYSPSILRYVDEIAPLKFYHPKELIPQLEKQFAIARLLDTPLPTHFAPKRVWDSLFLGEVVHLINQMKGPFAPILCRFVPSK